MKILTRYILREHIGPFLFSLMILMFVFVTKFLVQYINRFIGKGLSVQTIMELIYLNLAWMLALAIPMSVLVASLMAFGRMSADNEIIILKSSGINIVQIVRPALLGAAVVMVFMIWFNDRVLPEFNHEARLLFQSISRKKPTLQLEPGVFLKIKKMQMFVEAIERPVTANLMAKSDILAPEYETSSRRDRLKHVIIFDQSNSDVQRTVIADYGFLYFDEQRERLVLNLFNGEIHEMDTRTFREYRRLHFERNVFYIPAPEMVFKREESDIRGDREMSIGMMKERIAQYRENIRKEQQKVHDLLKKVLYTPEEIQHLVAVAADSAPPVKPDTRAASRLSSIQVQMDAARSSMRYYQRQINKLEVEIHKKYSIPFAAIVFVLIGAPLGIKARKGSLGVGFTFSLGFFILYWACLIGGEELADRQLLSPFWAMWFPNVIVGLWGVYLTFRTVKETVFFQWERVPKFIRIFFQPEESTTP